MSVKRLALVCSAFFFSFSAHAFSSTSTGNVVTFAPTTVTPANVGGYTVSTASNGTVLLKGPRRMSLPGGGSIPVDVTGGVSRATASAAILRGLARFSLPLAVGIGVYDLAKEMGFTLDNSSGDVTVVANTVQFGYQRTGQVGPIRSTILQICHDYGATPATSGFLRSVTQVNPTYDNISIGCSWPANPGGNTYGALRWKTPADQPATIAELEAAINAKENNWTVTSAMHRALEDAIKSGENVAVQSPTVTGPATSPGPVTQTVDTVNGTTTTSTTTNHHTYAGPNITTTTTTTNVTVNNSTGAVISSTTTTAQPVVPEPTPEENLVATDTPLPAQPKLYEPEYPEGLVGVWNDKKAQLDSAPLVALVSQLMPSISGAGSCPVWTIPVDVGFFNAGVLDFSVPCWIWAFAKVIVICSALLLARQLVFGG